MSYLLPGAKAKAGGLKGLGTWATQPTMGPAQLSPESVSPVSQAPSQISSITSPESELMTTFSVSLSGKSGYIFKSFPF